MAATYGKKAQTSNSALVSMTSARYIHVDGTVTTPLAIIPSGNGGRLLRVILNTNGATLRIRSNSNVIANIALDAPEQTFNYGVYVNDGLIVEAGGVLDATIVFDR